MNKKDLIPVVLCVLLIPVWIFVDQKIIAPKFPAKAPVPAEQSATDIPSAGNIEAAALTETAPEKPVKVTPKVKPTTEPSA